MTKALEAGRESDVLVAQRVMGQEPVLRTIRLPYYELEAELVLPGDHDRDDEFRTHWAEWVLLTGTQPETWEYLQHYTTAIGSAWKLVEHFVALHHDVQLFSTIGGYGCRISGVWGAAQEHAETATLAICRAALAAVGST